IIVDGFGLFHDALLKDIPDGLVLFAGDNEAGKSTMLGFIRAVLFGFPDGRTAKNPYEPLKGGQHGGRLIVSTAARGDTIIERKAGKKGGPVNLLFTSDDTRGGEAELKHLLGGFSEAVYRNVYAFSLEELQTFDSLNDDDVRGALYGAGAGVSLMAIPESMKRLEKNLTGLFKPGGSKPVINTRIARLEEVQKELRHAANGIKEYEGLTGQSQKLSETISRLQQEGEGFQKDQTRKSNYLKLWDQWIILQEAEDKLGNLDDTVSVFPAGGLNRMRDLEKNLENLGKSLDREEKNQTDLLRQEQGLKINELLLDQESKINELKENLNSYLSSVDEVSGNRQVLEQKKGEIQRSLEILGKDWTEGKVCKMDRSLFTRNSIRKHQSALQKTTSEQEKAEDALKQIKEELDAARREEETAVRELDKYRELEDQVARKTLQAIQNGRNQFASLVKDLPQRKKELKSGIDSLDQAVGEIDPDWGVPEVESFDCSVPAQEKIQEFEHEQNRLNSEINGTKNRLEIAQSGLTGVKKELKENQEKYDVIPEPSLKKRGDYADKKDALKNLKDNLNKKELLKERIRHQNERLSDKHDLIQKSLSVPSNPMAGFLKVFSIVIFLIGVAVAAGLIIFQRPLEGGLIGGAFVILGGCIFIVNKRADSRQARQDLSNQSKGKREIQELEGLLDNLRNDLAGLERQAEEISGMLGIAGDIEPDKLYPVEKQLEQELMLFDEKIRSQEELDKIKAQETQAIETITHLAGTLKSQENVLKLLQDKWEKHLAGLSLRSGTNPRMASLIFAKVDRLKTMINGVGDIKERIKEMEQAKEDYLSLLSEVPALAEKTRDDPADLLSAVDLFLEQSRERDKQRQYRDLAVRTLEEKKKILETVEEKQCEAKDRTDKADTQQNRTAEEWRDWLSNAGLDPEISPETALSAMETINECIRLIDTRTTLEQDVGLKQNEIRKYLDLTGQVFSISGKTQPDKNNIVSEIKLLYQEYEDSKTNRTKKGSIQEQLAGLKNEIESLKQEIGQKRLELKKLLQEGEADDEEEFIKRGELYQKRRDILQEIEGASGNIKIISGERDLKKLKQDLKQNTREELDSELRRLQQEIREIDENLEAVRDELAETKNKLETLASSDDISRLRAEEEKIKEEILIDAGKWGTNAIARYLITSARERFEKEHQPRVIQEAAGYFNTFTGGEYQNIIAPLGRQSIEVMTRHGIQKKPHQLSRATAEQLFLALRFGYMTNQAENTEVPPVIMDDILVNFDENRSRYAAGAILELAGTHQILFFTCHPETISVFKKQDKNIPVYQIKQGKFEESKR
ncbi:MAG: AAA family ATPase, partial [Thermodesulfobacteriota bacterium]|nr:AAA family ATPase [Thermodesulfobacteriota bacterium]